MEAVVYVQAYNLAVLQTHRWLVRLLEEGRGSTRASAVAKWVDDCGADEFSVGCKPGSGLTSATRFRMVRSKL